MIILDDPPSLDAGEITDKGTLNQQAVRENRAELVEELSQANPSAQCGTCFCLSIDLIEAKP